MDTGISLCMRATLTLTALGSQLQHHHRPMPQCILGIFKSISGHFSAVYLDVLLGPFRSLSHQQRHRAAAKTSSRHPAAVNPIDLQSCCYQLIQLRAAHVVVVPGERRPGVSPMLHPTAARRAETQLSAPTGAKSSNAGCLQTPARCFSYKGTCL